MSILSGIKKLFSGKKGETHVVVGDLTVLKTYWSQKDGKKYKRVKTRCVCGTIESFPAQYLTRKGNPKTHCGCKRSTIGSRHHEEYVIWSLMHQRCYNPQHVSFKHYGGRGITIDKAWLRTEGCDPMIPFKAFFDHIGPRPSKGHTVDRIRVNEGYKPGNVRWTTAEVQAANKRRVS